MEFAVYPCTYLHAHVCEEVLKSYQQDACRMSQAGVLMAAATVSAEASSSNLSSYPLQIDFDNDGDPDVTLISVSGPDQRDLLMQLTGAFNSMQLVVVAATIITTQDGRVRDVFKITDQQHQKVYTCAKAASL